MSGAGARPLLPRLTPSLASSISGALAVLAGLLALVVGSSLPSEYQGAFDVVRLPPTGAPTQTAGLSSRLAVKLGSLPSDNQKAWLGVNIQSMELPLALSLGLRNAKGALITETVPNGPAARAGIRPGDIILNFNGNNLEDSTDLRQKVSHTAIDCDVVLEVWRVASPDGDFYAALRRLADGGNAYVMYHLGTMHEAGTGIAKDEREAVRWYQRAANAGSPHAMTSLGLMLIPGRGASKDQPEGLRLLKGAADRDHPEAMRRLAVLMVEGTVLTRNLPEAERLLTKSAEAGHVLAMLDLGDMYDARESEQGWSQAAKWYARAADRGNATAILASCNKTAKACSRTRRQRPTSTGRRRTTGPPRACTISPCSTTRVSAWTGAIPSSPQPSCCRRSISATSSHSRRWRRALAAGRSISAAPSSASCATPAFMRAASTAASATPPCRR